MNRKRASSSPCEGALDLCKKQRIEDEQGFLLIYTSPMSLKHLAGLRVALSVWRHHKIRSSKTYGYGFLKYNTRNLHGSIVYVPAYVNDKDYAHDTTPVLIKPIEDSIDELSLPKPVKKLVEDYGKFIQCELRYWAHCHDPWIKLESVDLNTDVVWKYDGFIDLLATVRKMLESTRFSLEERFNLMSEYCLEDEIRSISQRLINEQFFKKILSSYWNPNLRDYWKLYLHNSLDKLHNETYFSINHLMLFVGGARNNLESLAYFFNRLREHEVVPISIRLIEERPFESKYKAYVLSKLNRQHHHQVLLKCAKTVIIDLSRYSAYANYLSNVWINYKEHISNRHFFNIIFSLFQNRDIDETNVDHTETLLCDIWHTATDEMKNCIWSDISRIRKFLVNCFRLMAERWTFFKMMFNDASDDTKNVIVNDSKFSSFCVSSIETGQWYLCDSFIKICFSFASKQHVIEFKNTLMNTYLTETRYCKELIEQNLTKELQELLALYLPDSDGVMAYKKDLLTSKAHLKLFCFSELLADRVDELVETLDYVFSNPESAAKYRKELATQTRVLKIMCQYINEGKFGKMKALVDRLLVRSEDFELVKVKLWAHYKNIFKSGKCKQLRKVEWDEFLSWRSNSGKDEFKKSLPVDDIFMKMLKQTVFTRYKKDLNVELNFEELDYFLDWYFINKDQISQYKIDKIGQNDELVAILKNSPENGSAKKILEWFFDNDQQRIDEFKRTYLLDVSVLNV